MADRYWVGNSGNTNDTAHWSTTSGGAGGASVPTSADNAKFDANSFTLPGQTVTINASFDCSDMDWTGTTNSPILAGASAMHIYGNLTLISAMTSTFSSAIQFNATSTGKNVTTNGVSLVCIMTFNGVGGGWTLQDNVTTTNSFNLQNGTLNTNGKTVSCSSFVFNGTNVREIIGGTSTFNVSNAWTCSTITNLTFGMGSTTINMTGTNKIFTGGGLTYNIVNFTGSGSTIIGSNTFTTLKISAGIALNLTSATNQTVTSLICNGTTASPSTLQSVTAGSAATITLPAGRYFIRHTSIKDITISGATTVTSIAGTNVSGNTGITFVTKFEMGRIKNDGSFNWYNSTTGTVTKVSG